MFPDNDFNLLEGKNLYKVFKFKLPEQFNAMLGDDKSVKFRLPLKYPSSNFPENVSTFS